MYYIYMLHMYVCMYIVLMVTRELTRQYSCDDIYRGNPQYSKEMPVLFPLCQKNFHMDKPGLEARTFFAIKLRRLTDIVLKLFWRFICSIQ
jgi:hypothetical protein